jgi:hypothetical protein
MHAPAADPTVVSNIKCLQCGYNLRTLSESGNCPECGRRVSESLTAETLTRIPARVGSLLVRATEMLLLAGVASAATSFGPWDDAFGGRALPLTAQALVWTAALLPPVAAFWGVMLMARSLGPEAGAPLLRWCVRCLLVLTAGVCTLGPALRYVAPLAWRSAYVRHEDRILLTIVVSAVAATIVIYLRLYAVMRTARRRWLAWQCVALAAAVSVGLVWSHLDGYDGCSRLAGSSDSRSFRCPPWDTRWRWNGCGPGRAGTPRPGGRRWRRRS